MTSETAVQRALRALEDHPHATSVLVICSTKGCEVGRTVETVTIPVWKPKDAQFDATLAGDNPFRGLADGDNEGVILRSAPIQPLPLDDIRFLEAMFDIPASIACLVGACRHRVQYVPLDELMRERRRALDSGKRGKLVALPNPR